MKRLLCAAIGLVFLAGCVIHLTDKGEAGFLYRSTTFIGVSHSTDKGDESTAEYIAPSLEEWIVGRTTSQPTEVSTNGFDEPGT